MKTCNLFNVLLVILVITNCASSPKEVTTDLEVKGQFGESSVGINKDNKIIVQEKTRGDDELRSLTWANNDLETAVNHERQELEDCRLYLADSRLGGGGSDEHNDLPTLANQSSDTTEEVGLDERGDLIILKEEDFNKRLQNERRRRNSLQKEVKLVKKYTQKCKIRLASGRASVSLKGVTC